MTTDIRYEDELEERRIEALLAPLQRVEPVAMRATPIARRRRPRARAVALAAAIAVVSMGATYGILQNTRVEATASPLSPGGEYACQGLEGMRADDAERFFAARSLDIDWRFMEHYAPGRADGLSGYAHAPASVPADSVVFDVARRDGATVIVFVRAPGDPYAPPLPTPAC